MAYKSIFLIGNAYGSNAVIPKGINGSLRLMKHNYRTLKDKSKDYVSQEFKSYIDPKRTKFNMYFNEKNQKWILLDTTQKRQSAYNYGKRKLDYVLEPFKDQFEVLKQKRLKKYEKTRYGNFQDYLSKKQPMGEWVLSGSRDWFNRNQVIEIINERKFIVKNEKKLLQWANTVQEWAIGQIETFYGENSFLSSTLHLDESNIHIHFNFFRSKLIWDKRIGKRMHSFTNQGFLNPQKIRFMQQDYREFQNKRLFNELGWDKDFQLQKLDKNKKYLKLSDWKKEQKYNEKLQILSLENNNLKAELYQKPNYGEKYHNAKQKLYKAILKDDKEMQWIAKEELKSCGIKDYRIEDIENEIRMDIEFHKS